MIQSVTIENFKSFERATLPLAPLTLLIGANASGKSNAIEAMQLLAWLATGRPPADLLYVVREQELSLRGGFKDLLRHDGVITLGCELEQTPRHAPLAFSISLGMTEEGLRIRDERLTALGPESALLYEQGLADPSGGASLAVFAALDERSREQADQTSAEASRLRTVLMSMLFLDPDPRRMREYSFVQEKRLKRDGSAVSSVLRHLTVEEGRKSRILETIRFLPEQDISGITYLETPRDEVMVQLHETFGGKLVPREAALLSDGTLRVLAVAAALFSVDEGSTVVIEEIDNGVHPSRAEHLLSQVQRVARERNLRVLLTTHNPALLDALPLDAIPDTVACYRDPEKGDSRLVRLQDLESYPELVAQGPLGRLLTRGIVDRYLKSPDLRDRAKKVERDLAWIKDFRRQVRSS
jgi:predicted ATPase